MNKRHILIIPLALASAICADAAVAFSGNSKPIITESPAASTGLNDVFVLYDLNGVSAQYKATSSTTIRWYRFSTLGGGYAEEIPSTQDGRLSTLTNLQGDMGYIVEDGNNRYYFWVVDYSSHRLTLSSVDISQESDCTNTILSVQGVGARILYYSINGAPQTLSRDIELAYQTLVWDAASASYRQADTTASYQYLSEILQTSAPLCDTNFALSGDKFLRIWGEEAYVESVDYPTPAVGVETSAVQTVHEADNEQSSNTSSSLGGSAPCEIEFSATVTDAAIYKEWQFATDAEFENLIYRYNDLTVNHTFREYGTTYVRFMASNAEGSCDQYSETYQVEIGESAIDCPNAFSPGSTEGINDEWRVSYKSLISFECHIFNRWGQQMIEFTDPSQGWDGRYNGKLVPAGVYYYVIKAVGSDGKQYKLNGDINIINFKDNRRTSTTTE